MQKKLPFKPLMSAVIITSLFAIANPASALTKVSGITIDGEDKGTLSGATLEIGSDLSTILVKPGKTTNVGKPILATNGSKLVMKGEDITLNGENSGFGIWVYDFSNVSGEVFVGTVNTNSLNISAQKAAVSNESGTVILDAQNIAITTTRSSDGTGAIEMWGKATAGDAKTIIGEHAKTISIAANQDKINVKQSGSAIRVLNGGTLILGGNATENVTVTANHKGASFGIYAESRLNPSDVTIHGKNITIDSRGDQTSTGVFANVNGTVAIGEANQSKEALQKPPLPSRMEQKCSVRLFLTTPECAVFLPMQ